MGRREHIEQRVRARLAEVMSSAGVDHSRISLEVLYLLPPEFLDAYIELYHRAFKDSSSSIGNPDAISVKKTKGSQIRPAVQGKRYKNYWQIRDEKAFTQKQRVDRKLRALIKEIRTGEAGKGAYRARCKGGSTGGCGRYVEEKWSYCGWCGNELVANDED